MFEIDPIALLILGLFLCACLFLYRYFRFQEKEPVLTFSSLYGFKGRSKTALEKYQFIPNVLQKLSLFFFGLAFLDPHLVENREAKGGLPPSKGLAIFLVLDRSGSMGKIVDEQYENGSWHPVTRIDVMKEAAENLVVSFPNDLIGVVAFARAAIVISPLTLDHQLLIDRIRDLYIVKSFDQDGTSMGYALYKTAHLIASLKSFQASLKEGENPPYKIQKSIMIIVTDGFQDPSLLDKGNRLRSMELDVAAAYAKEQGIKVYIVNVDPTTLNQEKYIPNRNELERAAEATGGSLVMVNHIQDLSRLIENIPNKELSTIYPQGRYTLTRKMSFYPYLIGLGLVLMGLSIALNETIWRKSL